MFAALPASVPYTGIDFSPARIGRLRELRARPDLKARFHTLAAVELRCKGADELQWVESNAFDTIALPSVIQYFPTVDYLLCVLDTILGSARTGPDGSVFIGDVRSLLLLEAFHASVQLFKANPDDRAGNVAALAVESSSSQEQELAVDPSFFLALEGRYPQIRSVEILPKRGLVANRDDPFPVRRDPAHSRSVCGCLYATMGKLEPRATH